MTQEIEIQTSGGGAEDSQNFRQTRIVEFESHSHTTTTSNTTTITGGGVNQQNQKPAVPVQSARASAKIQNQEAAAKQMEQNLGEILAKSKGLAEPLKSLSENGSTLWKVRSPKKWYPRVYFLDIGEMKLNYRLPASQTCVPAGSVKKRSVNLNEIENVVEGWKTETFTLLVSSTGGKIPRPKEPKDKAAADTKEFVDENSCFSILYQNSKKKSLDLVASSPEVAADWVRCLKYLISWRAAREQEKIYESWARKIFTSSADMDKRKAISYPTAKKLLEELNIHLDDDHAKRLFKEANVRKPNREALDENEFISLYLKLVKRPDVEAIFDEYAQPNGVFTANELRQFLRAEQQNFASVSTEECQNFISAYEQSDFKTKGQMTYAGLLNFLRSPHCSLFKDEQKNVWQDMEQPLSHYYIASSHKTYLMGHQLSGISSIEGYIDALKRGCRCVELDLREADDGEPMVTHGWTLTTKIFLKEVLRDAIAPYAFVKTNYPLIISLEDHTSQECQERVVEYFQKYLGDLLYDVSTAPTTATADAGSISSGEDEPPAEPEILLPSPTELLSKIIVTEKLVRRTSNLNGPEGGTGTLTATLANQMRAISFTSFSDAKLDGGSYYQMGSWSELQAHKCIQQEGPDFVDYNKRQLSRVYPSGSRIESSNCDPTQFWNAGCQIVALNYQTADVPNYINFARFAANGSCGFYLKPEFLRNPTTQFDPNELQELKQAVLLKLRVISGQNLVKTSQNLCRPSVIVKILGLHQDATDFSTAPVAVNAINPGSWAWNEEFEVLIRCPELAILYFEVKGQSLADPPLGVCAIPVTAISSGYGHLQLQDLRGEPLQSTTLFVQLTLNSWMDL